MARSQLNASHESEDEEASRGVPWKECMAYERAEILNEMLSAFSKSLFAQDPIQILVVDTQIANSGFPVEDIVGLVIQGRASSLRQILYEMHLKAFKYRVSDIMCRVQFGAALEDPLPNFPLHPLKTNPQFIAKRHWQRATMAMRCGFVKKIGDARASKQINIEEAEARIKRRPFEPAADYYAAAGNPCISCRRFCLNLPTVFVVWASWDNDSMAFLRKHIFQPAEQCSTWDITNDPWVLFCSRYVDFAGVQEAIETFSNEAVENRAKPHKPADHSSIQAAHACPKQHQSYVFEPNKPTEETSQRSKPVDDGGFANSTSNLSPRKKKKKNRLFASLNGHTEALKAFSRSARKDNRQPRLCHLVLVSVDHEQSDAETALRRLRSSAAPKSPFVPIHEVWAGKGGLHSDFSTFLNVTELPFVFASAPIPSSKTCCMGMNSKSYEHIVARHASPVITMLPGLENPVARRASFGEGGALRSMRPDVKKWHQHTDAQRKALIAPIAELQSTSTGQLVLEATKESEFPFDGPKVTDALRESSTTSSVMLRGTITDKYAAELQPHILALANSVADFFFDITVIESSPPLRIDRNERTAEHRVNGWEDDVTCTHCKVRLHVKETHHFHCLHCRQAESTVCESCLSQHDPEHVVALVHKGVGLTVPVVWGASNVTTIPLHDIRFDAPNDDTDGQFTEATKTRKLVDAARAAPHVGVYCNACLTNIAGVRWKCALCQDVDLCEECFGIWFERVKQGQSDKRHNTTHTFLRISHALIGDTNAFLVPTKYKYSL